MQVLVVEPKKAPYLKEVGEELEDLQREVGGFIEAVYPFEDDAAIICNEEGKLKSLELNRALYDKNGEVYDIIAGTFLITGLSEDGFASLSKEQIDQYARQYETPESFSFDGERVTVKKDRKKEARSDPSEKSIQRGGYTLIIREDPEPVSPRRSYDNFGTMILFDKTLKGDNHSFLDPDAFFLDRLTEHFDSPKRAEAYLSASGALNLPKGMQQKMVMAELSKDHVFLPVYLYRHGGDAVSTVPYSDPWDSGQIGWIYATKKQVTERFGTWNDFTVPLARQVLENEVLTYGDYIRGENYAYDIVENKSGKIIDGGFWTGDIESLKAFAFNGMPERDGPKKERSGDGR